MIAPADLARLSELVTDRIGLWFPPERYRDLERGLTAYARDRGVGLPELPALLAELDQTADLAELASHLTVGETFFFREPATFQALRGTVLPEMFASRRGERQHLRLWSCGCCTGEEPYSLAMLLCDLLPDLDDWHLTLVGTDLNPRFLDLAREGEYGSWSFRGVPEAVRRRYFQRTGKGRYRVVSEIRARVSFQLLNLASDTYPSLISGLHAMDLIFCRNVLMYFVPEQAARAAGRLRRTLADGGWLAVSVVEAGARWLADFAPVPFPETTLYQPRTAAAPPPVPEPPARRQPAVPAHPPRPPVQPAPEPTAAELYAAGRYQELLDRLLPGLSNGHGDPAALALVVRAFADQGHLAEAEEWGARLVRLDPLNPAAHYILATVRQEEGALRQAERALRDALYLDPEFILAHVALGNLARAGAHPRAARRHYRNAEGLLASLAVDEPVPESEGLTAGELREMVRSLAGGIPDV